jgi:hypothetical protein
MGTYVQTLLVGSLYLFLLQFCDPSAQVDMQHVALYVPVVGKNVPAYVRTAARVSGRAAVLRQDGSQGDDDH